MGEEAPVVGEPAMQEDVDGGGRTEQEVASQPACWRRAGAVVVWWCGDGDSGARPGCAPPELVLRRGGWGEAPGRAAAGAQRVLADPFPAEMLAARQFTFLGTGWTYGLANEAALKLREAAGMWTEAYPAMEYRHGPVAVTGPGSVVWLLGPAPDGLASEVAAAGGLAWLSRADPLAELVRVHRLAAAVARARR